MRKFDQTEVFKTKSLIKYTSLSSLLTDTECCLLLSERCFNGFDEVASWVTVIGDAVLDRLPLFFFGEAAVGPNFTGLLLVFELFEETEEDFEA